MFAKIFSQIYDSSIVENSELRFTFMDMLVLADCNGVVDMTHEAIARRTNRPIELIRKTIAELESPDAQSRTPDFSGARIKRLDDHREWGWMIVNYERFREIASEEQRRQKTLARVRKHRGKRKIGKSNALKRTVTTSNDSPSASPSKSASACTQKEVQDFCESLGLPRSDGEAMFLHWQEKGPAKVKDWKATIRKWKSFGYLPSQKIRPDRNGKGPVVPTQVHKPQPEGWEAWRLATYPESKERDFWRVTGDVQAEFNQQRKQMKGTA